MELNVVLGVHYVVVKLYEIDLATIAVPHAVMIFSHGKFIF